MKNTRYQKAVLGGVLLSFGSIAVAADGVVTTNSAVTTDAKQAYQLSQKSRQYNISAGDLTKALNQYAQKAGVPLVFDPGLTQGKTSQGLNGQYGLNEGFSALLQGTDLEVIENAQGEFALKRKPKSQSNETNLNLEEVQVRAKRFYEIGPLPGLGLTKEQIPGNVQSITAEEIKNSHALSMADLMNSKLQSVNVNDYQGNPFQMDVTYRGFTASPQLGTPQGLSVFFDGIRVNEPFGDVVNWDMIPMNALAGVDVFPGSNPIFGLGTLGGAFAMKTKDGFNHEGVDVEVLTGSYGRKQLQVSSGWNNGTIGLFGAGNFFMEDGWRENSPSKVNQFFGKASYRGDKLDLNLSTLIVGNDLVGNGLLPSEMYQQNRKGVFTSPDSTDNRLKQFQLSGSYFVNDNFSITAQAYRRDSKRHSIGGDVYTDHEELSNIYNRDLKPGEEYTCLYNSTNKYGLPDYYIIDLPNNDFFQSDFILDYFTNGGVPNLSLIEHTFNQDLPEDFANAAMAEFKFSQSLLKSIFYVPADHDGTQDVPPTPPPTSYSNGEPEYMFQGNSISGNFEITGDEHPIMPFTGLAGFYYYTPDGTKHLFTPIKAINGENCRETQKTAAGYYGDNAYLSEIDPKTGDIRVVNGGGSLQTGVVEGTPTAVLTDNQINQLTDGASIQFNWNFEKHKFMVGASIDRPTATYINSQRLGLLDLKRNAYLAPDEIRDQYAAADQDISNNNFSGHSMTKSIYASETWTPIETLNITGAIRYNDTNVSNKLAQRLKGESYARLSYYQNLPDLFGVCVDGVCPSTGYKAPDLSNLYQKPETEKFSYYSLNPSFGATWQANPNLNIYGNWAQGVRTPSVIELGCAFDHTLIDMGARYENGVEVGRNVLEKSLAEGRSCQLPSTLSGDPYLPQIKAQTLDLGMRGMLGNTFASAIGATNIEWNLGAFRTDLKDDIYLVTYPGDRSFFDTIGKTRRQGIEAGLTANFGKTTLKLNYALTDATFQDSFNLAADDNSTATIETAYCNPSTGTCQYSDDRVGRIKVKPGNRMPGVPLHNLNTTIGYEITPKWQIGLTAVAHSESFLRGNENNQHQPGVARNEVISVPDPANPGRHILVNQTRTPSNNKGKVPGYATFNLQSSYKLSSEWTLGVQINNIFDKEYFSAGRLGRNPFSPSINGAIGAGGYNHNSSDWLATSFLAPGAPRGAWFSLNWHFDPNKKPAF